MSLTLKSPFRMLGQKRASFLCPNLKMFSFPPKWSLMTSQRTSESWTETWQVRITKNTLRASETILACHWFTIASKEVRLHGWMDDYSPATRLQPNPEVFTASVNNNSLLNHVGSGGIHRRVCVCTRVHAQMRRRSGVCVILPWRLLDMTLILPIRCFWHCVIL